MTPLYQLGEFGYPVAMALATVLGIGFGFVLERAGFGRAGVLVSQFYGDDMRVLKVMFSGVVTTMVGLGLLAELGVIDLTLIHIPETFVGPAIVGGLVLGAGFVISGYCPGTALVAMGSGHLDGFMALMGIMIGSLAFGFGYDGLADFYLSGGMGKLTFVQVLDAPWPLLALAVTLMAVGAFLGGEWVERRFAVKHGRPAPAGDVGLRNALFAAMGAVALLALLPLPMLSVAGPKPIAAQTGDRAHREPLAAVDALTLAEHLARGHRDLYVVDLRAPATCAKQRLPDALCMTAEDPEAGFLAALAPTRTLVFYGADDDVTPPAGVARFRGDVRRLRGGFAAWEQQVLTAPPMPTDAEALEPGRIGHHHRRNSLHRHFTGTVTPQAPLPMRHRPSLRVRARAPKGGGC